MYVIPLPEKLSFDKMFQMVTYLYRHYIGSMKENEVLFDFSKCRFISPTGIVYVDMWREELNDQGIKTFYKNSKRSSFNEYIETSGLIRRNIKQMSMNSHHMIQIKRCMNMNECMEKQNEVSTIMERNTFSKSSIPIAGYFMGELWDNAAVHGYECYETIEYTKPVYIAGFVYGDRIEIAIGDRGQGIHSSLKNNPQYDKLTAQEAIMKSLEDGVSGHPKGSPGFGLYGSSRVPELGNAVLSIISSGYRYIIHGENGNKRTIKPISYNKGTIATLIVYKNYDAELCEITGLPDHQTDEYFENYLEDLFE